MRKKRRWRRSATAVLVLAVALGVEGAEKKKSKAAPQAILFGSVFQENGFLLRGARVVVWNSERPKQRQETTSDVQGEFSVRVPAGKGKYTVEVSAPGFQSQQKTVEIVGDERIDLTFRLAPPAK